MNFCQFMSTIYDAIIFTGEGKICSNVCKKFICKYCIPKILESNKDGQSYTAKLLYNGLSYNGYSVNADFFWSGLIIWLKQTQLIQTFVYYIPVFRSQHYRHTGYNRLPEITTMASVVT